MPAKIKKSTVTSLEGVFQIWAWILLAWSLYRYFLVMPEWADELIFKPLVFFLPVVIYVFKKEKRGWESLGITGKNIFTSLYIGIGFGFMFALEGIVANRLKNGKMLINPIEVYRQYGMLILFGISLATAVWEETLNRGFLFNRIYGITRNLFYSVFISAVLFTLLHVPILVTSLKLQGPLLGLFFLTNFLLGIINSMLFARTKSIVAPAMVHLFWNMTVALFL
jgi:membrane protease YdiL (CAAX protease family)